MHHGDHLFVALCAADGAGDLVVVVVAQGLYPVDLYGLLLSLALGDGEHAVLVAVTDGGVFFLGRCVAIALKVDHRLAVVFEQIQHNGAGGKTGALNILTGSHPNGNMGSHFCADAVLVLITELVQTGHLQHRCDALQILLGKNHLFAAGIGGGHFILGRLNGGQLFTGGLAFIVRLLRRYGIWLQIFVAVAAVVIAAVSVFLTIVVVTAIIVIVFNRHFYIVAVAIGYLFAVFVDFVGVVFALFVLFIDHIYFFAVFIDLCAKLGVCIGQTGLGGVGGRVLSVCLFGRAGSKDAADQYAQRHDQCNTLFQREHAPFGALHRNISYIIVFLYTKGKGYGCKSPNVYHLFIFFTDLAKWIIMNTNGKGGGVYAPCG